MPIKFIGNYDVLAEGKYLFEILAQLRDFGVGRMVTKGAWRRRWPEEPSYCVIKKVEPEMDRWLIQGKMWADWVFRGKPLGIYLFSKELDRCDWHLIHRHEEADFKRPVEPPKLQLPATIPMAPLEKFLQQVRGADVDKVPKEIRLCPDLDEEFKLLDVCFQENASALRDRKEGDSTSVYDRFDRAAYFDFYGKELPCKIEKWNAPS
uniref:28S ribosomal protein S34, mitochondrial n=1 Tax=Trichuris muris TaxID=70415 RepID=A0A5S6QZX0_TRIMR